MHFDFMANFCSAAIIKHLFSNGVSIILINSTRAKTQPDYIMEFVLPSMSPYPEKKVPLWARGRARKWGIYHISRQVSLLATIILHFHFSSYHPSWQ
jgi:hypothetical protein